MTNVSSVAKIVREVSSMTPGLITDARALELHTQYMRAAGRRPESIRGRRGAIRRLHGYLDPNDENPRAVLDATSDQLTEWYADRANLATKSIAVYVSHVQVYYQWCVRPMKIIPESPAADLVVPTVRRRLPRPVPEDALQVAMDACTDWLTYAWIVLTAYAGLRPIDISDLNRDDVLADREPPILRVRGKGDNEATIFIGHQVVLALTPFIGTRRGPMFLDQNGHRFLPRVIGGRLNDHLRALGLPYTCQQLRHRYGSKVYRLTLDIRYTQRQLRHRHLASTEIYVETPTDKAADSVKALDADLEQRRTPKGWPHNPAV